MRRLRLVTGIVAALLPALVLLACGKAEAPEGELTASPSATAVTPAISVDQPQSDATVTVPVTVKGTASVFEGTVEIAVKDAGGNTLCRTFTTASEGAPGTGAFQTQVSFPPPPTASSGTVQVFSRSPKDGSVENLVSVPVSISAQQPAIVVTSPLCGAQVSSPALVAGTASVFEGAVVIVVRDSLGNELVRVNAQASVGAPDRGTFSQEVTFPPPSASQAGTIEAFSVSAADGSVQNLFSVPVVLAP